MHEIETGKYVVHLICSLLANRKPDRKPESISFEQLYDFSQFHNVSVMVLDAIKQLDEKPDEETLKKWEKRKNIAVAQSAVQIAERNSICRILEENAIDYIPLKGCLLKEMYPNAYWREMADLDFLIREKDRENVCRLMEASGYKSDLNSSKKDDSYDKKPFVRVEMHYRLLTEVSVERMNITDDLFLHPFDYAVKSENSCRYELNPADMYMHLLVHNAKHYYENGIGIRHFLDLKVFKEKNTVDEAEIQKRAQEIGLNEFKEASETIVDCWQKGLDVPRELEDMQSAIFGSGAFGSVEGRVHSNILKSRNIAGKSMLNYILYRLFPPCRRLSPSYPILKKYPILLPAVWGYRIFTRGIPGNSTAFQEVKEFSSVYKKDKK